MGSRDKKTLNSEQVQLIFLKDSGKGLIEMNSQELKIVPFYTFIIINQRNAIKLTMPNSEFLNNGKWSKTQHDRFIKALHKYGKNWTLIEKAVATRSIYQVRSHAQKMFASMTNSEIQILESQLQQRFSQFCQFSKEPRHPPRKSAHCDKRKQMKKAKGQSPLQFEASQRPSLLDRKFDMNNNDQHNNEVCKFEEVDSKQAAYTFVNMKNNWASLSSQCQGNGDKVAESFQVQSSNTAVPCFSYMQMPTYSYLLSPIGLFWINN